MSIWHLCNWLKGLVDTFSKKGQGFDSFGLVSFLNDKFKVPEIKRVARLDLATCIMDLMHSTTALSRTNCQAMSISFYLTVFYFIAYIDII